MDFFSDKWAPKLGGPPAAASYPQQQAPPPPQQMSGYPPPPQYYYPQHSVPIVEPHSQYPGAPTVYDPRNAPLPHDPRNAPPPYDPRNAPPTQHLYPPTNEFGRGNRSKRSASSDSSYSSRSPSPPRSPLRVSGSSRRHGRRHDSRRRSRSKDRRVGSSRRYLSPDNHSRRRGREDDLRRDHRSSNKSSPFNQPVETSEARSTVQPIATVVTSATAVSANSTSVSTTVAATVAAATSTAASTSTAAAAASSTTSVFSEATSVTEESKTESYVESSQELQPQLQASTDSSVTPSVSVETVPDVAVGAVEPSDDAVAPSDKAVKKSLGGGSEAASSSADVTSGAASDATAADTGTEGDAVLDDVLDIGVEDDDLLAEVQSADLLTSEQDKQSKEVESKTSRTRHNSEEYRKRREERERRRRQKEEEDREAREKKRQERNEERRKQDKVRREERERRRQDKEKEEEMNRLVGKGKTLPDRPSVVKLSGAKAKSSGDETSDPQSSQAQSPVKDVPELDILDEDAMLAVFRERALLSMQEKKRQKILEKKEQRRQEKIQQQQQANARSKSTEPETKKVVAAGKPASGGDKMKRIGPVAAAVIAGEPPKKINKISTKPTMTEEEMEEKLLMSSDEEEVEEQKGKELRSKSPPIPPKSEEVKEKKKPEPITFKKSEIRPLINPPESSSSKSTFVRIKPPVSSTFSEDKESATSTSLGPQPKKIISLKSSKWSSKKDDQDKENSRRLDENPRVSPSLEARLSPAPEPVVSAPSAAVKTTATTTKTTTSSTSTAAAVGKKIISLKANQERVVSKVASPKTGTSALERLGAPVKEDDSSDSLDSSSESSLEDEDTDESTSTKPRASVLKLAASVKSSAAEPVHAYEVATSSAPVKPAATLSEPIHDGTPEARWSDAVALSKKRRADAEAKRAVGREPISYEDLDAAFNTAPRVTSSDERITKSKTTSVIKVNAGSASCLSDSPSKLSATTKDDLLDLLELTAPLPSSAPPKNNNVDTESLLRNLPDAKKKQPAPLARPTWGRRRIEAPDSSSSTTASSRKLVIRRTTGPAAVAVATSGDAKREIDVRKRRLNKEPEDTDEREETEEDIAGFSPSISSPSTSPDRSKTVPTPPKKISPGGRRLGIQRPTWLASKAEKTKPTTSVTPSVASIPSQKPAPASTPAPVPGSTSAVVPGRISATTRVANATILKEERPSPPSVSSAASRIPPNVEVPSSTSLPEVATAPKQDIRPDAVTVKKNGKDTIDDHEKVDLDNADDYDDGDDNDDAILAQMSDDDDEFGEASAPKSTDDSKHRNPSLDSDDEDLFREIDAFL